MADKSPMIDFRNGSGIAASPAFPMVLIAAFIFAAPIPHASAQPDFLKFQCFDFYKRPVLNVKNDTLKDVAFSDLMRHRGIHVGPMIILNTKLLAKLKPPSQRFFIGHECAHHALGHLYFRRSDEEAEQQADCHAVRTLIRLGGFTFKDIADVQSDMRKFARASHSHLRGDARAKALMHCIAPGNQASKFSVYD